jgi:hypothetical protein
MSSTIVCALAAVLTASGAAFAQTDPAAHQHMMAGEAPRAWRLSQDGVITAVFNHQGGPRGGDEFVVPNWWMGSATRDIGRHQIGFTAMLSFDPATVGESGYREIFQVGEALDGKPLIDRQHPHDLLMQLAMSWRAPLAGAATLVIAGGPAGEPTLGPVAFMHRASAAGLFMAPLGHHTFDSTHISFNVLTAGIETPRWTIEASAFNGREPDQHRWDLDPGAMDSVAGRVWFRPSPAWELQVSSGRLRDPEELSPGDATRTTASASWLRQGDGRLSAATIGYGMNSAHGERRSGAFGEMTVERRAYSAFGRLEVQQVEAGVLATGEIGHEVHTQTATVAAVTAGATRPLPAWRGFEPAIGAAVTLYRVPGALTATHGSHPVSFQMFVRLRLPAGSMGRMWNMRMSQGHHMAMGMESMSTTSPLLRRPQP